MKFARKYGVLHTTMNEEVKLKHEEKKEEVER